MHPAGSLAARDISKSYGASLVLDRVSLVVPPRARIGVVGPNGIGKSTLLRILAGLEPPDSGAVEHPPELTVGYLPQEPDMRHGETLHEYLARRTGVAAAERHMEALAARLADEPELAQAYTEALDRFLALGGADFEARARAVCDDVGLATERLRQPVTTFSGGQAARATLAAVLLSRFHVLMLDEPTNDLDFAGLELLERFLDETRAALVVVSHDRELLDRIVTRVLELREGGGAREYAGGYADFVAVRERERRGEYEAFDRYVRERTRLEEQVRRRREWAERGVRRAKRRRTDNAKTLWDARAQGAENLAARNKAVERRLERLERVDKPYEPWELRLSLARGDRGGDVVARLAGAVVERGSFRLGPVDLELRRGDRLAVVGPNGSGKTTLLRALLGKLPLAAGTRMVGPSVVAGELEQGREAFCGERTVLAVVQELTGLAPADARTLLAKFELGARDVERPSSSLSPGERTRAALACFMAREANLLVLDEPTNHLDLEAIEELEDALERYEGTVVAVTHDRRFLERLGPTRTLPL